jgi:hypothetical protein
MIQDPNEQVESFNNIDIVSPQHIEKGSDQDGKIVPKPFKYLTQNDKTSQKKNAITNEVNSNQPTAEATRTKTEKATKKNNKQKKRPDDIRKSAFSQLMIILKILFGDLFKLNFENFKCSKVMGDSLRHFKKVLNLQIYQLLCYYPENSVKLMKFLKIKMKRSKKLIFFYFMTRTYKELYKRYISGNINFPIFPGGTLRISKFLTLQKVIKLKDKKGRNKIKNVSEFVKLSKIMLDDLKNKKDRKVKNPVDKTFTPIKLEIFDNMRNYFKEEDESASFATNSGCVSIVENK